MVRSTSGLSCVSISRSDGLPVFAKLLILEHKMKQDVYDTYTGSLHSVIRLYDVPLAANVRFLFRHIPFFTMAQRKEAIRFARTETIIDTTSPRYTVLQQTFSYPLLKALYQFDTPYFRSLLLMTVRNAPMTDIMYKQAVEDSFFKEYNVLTSSPPVTKLNFSCFFGHPDEEIYDGYGTNPIYCKHIQNIFDSWKEHLTKNVLFPRISKKSMSKSTLYNVRLLDYIDPTKREVSQQDLEIIYHNTGFEVGGNCEMRQKTYVAQLEPRTYYTSGGDAYRLTKYLAKPTVLLCDYFEPSHRKLRNIPTRLNLTHEDYAFIYDLTSYTSNLYEHSSFLYQLSLYCTGTTVLIMDATQGVIECDLGLLLHNLYTMHVFPKVDIQDRIMNFHYPTVENNVAGLLGVYGNMSTATFLHAIVVGYIVGDTNRINTPGDDGIVTIDRSEEPDVRNFIETLGILKMDKVYRTTERGSLHLKKTVEQIGTTLISMSNVYHPSLEYAPLHSDLDPRYPDVLMMTKSKRKSAAASSITSFLKSMRSVTVYDKDRYVIPRFLTWFYTRHSLPVQGKVPQFSDGLGSFVPLCPDDRYDYNCDPIVTTINNHYTEMSVLPVREKIPLRPFEDCHDETVFVANSCPFLVYLETLGYIIKKKQKRCVFGEEAYRETIKEYTVLGLPAVYDYTVVMTVPSFLYDHYPYV